MADAATTSVLIAAVAATSSLGTAWLTARFQKPKVTADTRKVDAETEQIIVATAARLVGSVRTQLEQLQNDHDNCQGQIDGMRRRISALEKALRDNDIALPVVAPDPGTPRRWQP